MLKITIGKENEGRRIKMETFLNIWRRKLDGCRIYAKDTQIQKFLFSQVYYENNSSSFAKHGEKRRKESGVIMFWISRFSGKDFFKYA